MSAAENELTEPAMRQISHPADNAEAELQSKGAQAEQSAAAAPRYSVFTPMQKRAIVLSAALTAFFSPLSAQIYLPALTSISHDLGVSNTQVNLTITTYMIFQGITPMFIGSLADSGGRRPAYIACFVIYIGANIGLALAPGYGAILGLRCLQSAGSSSTVALCMATVADVITSAERGKYVGYTVVPIVLAPALGPVIGGLLSQYLGWRSIFWFLTIFAGVTLVLLAMFFPETCRHIVGDGSITPPPLYRTGYQMLRMRRKASREKADDQDSGESTQKKKFKLPNILGSLLMLFEKETGFLLYGSSLVFAGFYCMVAAMPTLFKDNYGYNDIEVGLMYLPIAVGSIGAAFVAGPAMTWNYKRHCGRLGIAFDRSRQQDLSNFPIERVRLEVGTPLLVLATASLICWGWAIEANASVVAPCFLSALLGVGMIGYNNTVNTLLVDIHPGKAGTATAANNLTRCLVGAGASAAILPLIAAIGVGWAFTLISGFYVLCVAGQFLLISRGMKWRMAKERKKDEKLQREAEQEAEREAQSETTMPGGSEKQTTGEVKEQAAFPSFDQFDPGRPKPCLNVVEYWAPSVRNAFVINALNHHIKTLSRPNVAPQPEMSLERSSTVAAGLIMISWLIVRCILFVLVNLAIGLISLWCYRLFFHPLSRVRGPKIAALSNFWYGKHVRDGRMSTLGRTLHEKYGPVVRVGPNEVWFNSRDAFKAIYSAGSGFEKSDFYLATALSRPRIDWSFNPHFSDTLDFLSERDMKRYRLQRRLTGPVYQSSNVIKFAPAVDAVLDEAIERLKALKGGEIDLKEWMHIISVECLGAVVLSWSPGMLKQGTDGETSAHSYQGWRRKSVFGLFPAVVKAEASWKFVGRVFGNIWGVSFEAPKNFKTFFTAVQRRVSGRLKLGLQQPRGKPKKSTSSDLMGDLIQLHRDKPQFTQTYLRRMAITNFGAGHETMASTLTSILALIGSHLHVQETLSREIQHASNKAPDKLAYLQATIKEAKRLRPVIAMSLPRRVPSSGLHLHGHYFPPETTVGCNPVALHRNPDICGGASHPDLFDPDRWLGDGAAAQRMERFSLAWGGGARTCPGRHLAEMIVGRVVLRLMEEFEVQVDIPAEDEMPSFFLSMMTGVKARFFPRDP